MAYITLNKKHFFNNLGIIAKHTKTKDKIALVLKDNAYGHGLIEIASMAKEYGIKKAVVRIHDEAVKLDEFFEYILVLADIPKQPDSKIRYTINDIKDIDKFPKSTLVELKVDTGMHRNGICMDELEVAFERIKKTELILDGVFTHHRSADELTSEWFWQNDNFEKIKIKSEKLAKKFNFKPLKFHSANSASLFRTDKFNEDIARVGIAAYGCLDGANLKPVLSVYANKISSRELKTGERIGYGATYEVTKDCTVSNYDFGYGDGFLRCCSNKFITPNNQKQIGRISMDNSSFLAKEDELLIFNDAQKVAKIASTISYEVLTSLKASIKKVVL